MRTTKQRRSLAGSDATGERHRGFHAVGWAVSQLAAPIVAKRGGGVLVRLKADWAAIVGSQWASLAWPVALGRDGILKLHTVPVAALELQHSAPLLIERINCFLGRTAVTRLVLLQAVPDSASEQRRAGPRSLSDSAATVELPLFAIADPGLRAALARLGRAIAAADG